MVTEILKGQKTLHYVYLRYQWFDMAQALNKWGDSVHMYLPFATIFHIASPLCKWSLTQSHLVVLAGYILKTDEAFHNTIQ